MAQKIQVRRGTASAWTTANTLLSGGEVGFETDTNKFKFGDGVTTWTTLPYAASSSSTATPVSASTTIPLDTVGAGKKMAVQTITGATTFVPGPLTEGASCVFTVDGSGTPTFSGFLLINGYAYNPSVVNTYTALVQDTVARLYGETGPTYTPSVYAPNAVTSLANGTVTSTTVPLTWVTGATDSSHGAAVTYNVLFAPHGSSYTTFATGVTGTSSTVTGLTVSTAYDFEVVAVNTGGSSTATTLLNVSTAAAVFVPNAPTLTAGTPTSSTIPVTIAAGAVDGSHSATATYTMLFKLHSAGSYTTAATGVSGTSYTFTGLTASSSYDLQAVPVNTAGAGAAGSLTSVSTTATSGRSDNFNRANSTTVLGAPSDGGSGWTAHTGVWGITSNAAYLVTQAADSVATLDTGSATQDVTVSIVWNGDSGLIFRAIDDQNYWMILLNASGNSVDLYKRVAGTYTGPIATFSTTLIGGTTYTIRATASGSTITGYVNGTSRVSTTDSALSTATRVGIRQNAASNSTTFDNLVAV